MSSQSKNSALALHEILLSISDSLNEAQNQLRNMPPYDEYGRPNTIYHLPYLDFSIEVVSEVRMATHSGGLKATEPQKRTLAFGRRLDLASLRYNLDVPINQGSGHSSNKVTSNISGRFVAVLPNEGMPQIFITVSAKPIGSNTYKVVAKLVQAGGAPVVGQLVETNFDRDTSESISSGSTLPQPVFIGEDPNERFAKEGLTNEDGEFATTIALPPNATKNQYFVFVVNSGPVFSSVSINKP